jgi:DNA-binding YbaB/EbfC family protein
MDSNNIDFKTMMASFMQNAQKMQENLKEAYQDVATKNQSVTVQGKAGGDLATAHVNLKLEITELELKPELFEESHEVIAELVMAAVNQGLFLAQNKLKQEMMERTKKMGLPPDLMSSLERG